MSNTLSKKVEWDPGDVDFGPPRKCQQKSQAGILKGPQSDLRKMEENAVKLHCWLCIPVKLLEMFPTANLC